MRALTHNPLRGHITSAMGPSCPGDGAKPVPHTACRPGVPLRPMEGQGGAGGARSSRRLPQRDTHWPEVEVCQAAPGSPASEDGQPCPRTQGCVWLRCYVPEKCAQHFDRLHPLPVNFCHGRCPTVQRQVFLLHRPIQTQRQRMPVSDNRTTSGNNKNQMLFKKFRIFGK